MSIFKANLLHDMDSRGDGEGLKSYSDDADLALDLQEDVCVLVVRHTDLYTGRQPNDTMYSTYSAVGIGEVETSQPESQSRGGPKLRLGSPTSQSSSST